MNTSLFRIVALGLSALWATTGCRKTDDGSVRGTAIEVVSQIDAAQQAKASRASTTVVASKSTFVSNDQIGVWVAPYLNSDNSNGGANLKPAPWQPKDNYADNVVFTSNGTIFAPDAGKEVYFPTAQTLVDLYSVYPYDSKMSNPTNNTMTDPTKFEFAIAQDQTTAAAVVASDLLTAKAPKAVQGAPIQLTFTHRLSHILVYFTVPAQYQNSTVNGVVQVEVCGIPLKATVNLSDATVAATASTTSNPAVNILAYKAGKPDGGVVAGSYTYEAIVMPGTVVASGANIVRITLDVEDKGNVVFDCKLSAAYTYAATESTKVSVSIADETAITLAATDVKIAAWGDQTPPVIETVKPARMILDVTNNANIAKAATVKSATLTIDAVTYTKVPAEYDDATKTITIVYPQSNNVWGYDLTSLALNNAAGTPIAATYTPAPAPGNKIPILGNPTAEGYNTKIGISVAF